VTGDILPQLEDDNNHVIDALRYALEGVRRAGSGRFEFLSSGPRTSLVGSAGYGDGLMPGLDERAVSARGCRSSPGVFSGSLRGWSLHDRWIISRLNRAARDVDAALAAYDFYSVVQTLYHFFWDDFCDWYIELTKADVTAAEASPERDAARSRLVTVLEQALRLLHPLMPFLTEELWQRLPGIGKEMMHPAYTNSDVSPTIMLSAYPQANEELIDEAAETQMQAVIEVISRVRNIRAGMNIKPSEQVRLNIFAPDEKMGEIYRANTPQIVRLARASNVTVMREKNKNAAGEAAARAVLAGGGELAIPLEGLIDFAQERGRLEREREKLQKEAGGLEAQLGNAQFVERAPAEKVQALRERLNDITQRVGAIGQMLEALSS
jgi:valyl-tRNA synthetase